MLHLQVGFTFGKRNLDTPASQKVSRKKQTQQEKEKKPGWNSKKKYEFIPPPARTLTKKDPGKGTRALRARDDQAQGKTPIVSSLTLEVRASLGTFREGEGNAFMRRC